MPSEFYILTLAGFREAAATQIGCAVARNGFTVRGIATPVIRAQDLKDQGYEEMADTLVDVAREDLGVLGLTDLKEAMRSRAQVSVDGKLLKLLALDDDAADPCVKLHLILVR